MQRNRQIMILIGIGVAVVVVVIIVLAIQAFLTRNNPQITIETSPRNAHVTVNGGSSGKGTVRVPEGEVTVEASYEGFETFSITREITTDSDDTYFGIILKPLTPEASELQQQNIENQHAEMISGRITDQNAETAVNQTPLMRQLPYLGEGLAFRIDYGLPVDEERTQRGVRVIEISAATPQTRQQALDWIVAQGIFLHDLEIIFKDYKGPIFGSGGEQYER